MANDFSSLWLNVDDDDDSKKKPKGYVDYDYYGLLGPEYAHLLAARGMTPIEPVKPADPVLPDPADPEPSAATGTAAASIRDFFGDAWGIVSALARKDAGDLASYFIPSMVSDKPITPEQRRAIQTASAKLDHKNYGAGVMGDISRGMDDAERAAFNKPGQILTDIAGSIANYAQGTKTDLEIQRDMYNDPNSNWRMAGDIAGEIGMAVGTGMGATSLLSKAGWLNKTMPAWQVGKLMLAPEATGAARLGWGVAAPVAQSTWGSVADLSQGEMTIGEYLARTGINVATSIPGVGTYGSAMTNAAVDIGSNVAGAIGEGFTDLLPGGRQYDPERHLKEALIGIGVGGGMAAFAHGLPVAQERYAKYRKAKAEEDAMATVEQARTMADEVSAKVRPESSGSDIVDDIVKSTEGDPTISDQTLKVEAVGEAPVDAKAVAAEQRRFYADQLARMHSPETLASIFGLQTPESGQFTPQEVAAAIENQWLNQASNGRGIAGVEARLRSAGLETPAEWLKKQTATEQPPHHNAGAPVQSRLPRNRMEVGRTGRNQVRPGERTGTTEQDFADLYGQYKSAEEAAQAAQAVPSRPAGEEDLPDISLEKQMPASTKGEIQVRRGVTDVPDDGSGFRALKTYETKRGTEAVINRMWVREEDPQVHQDLAGPWEEVADPMGMPTMAYDPESGEMRLLDGRKRLEVYDGLDDDKLVVRNRRSGNLAVIEKSQFNPNKHARMYDPATGEMRVDVIQRSPEEIIADRMQNIPKQSPGDIAIQEEAAASAMDEANRLRNQEGEAASAASPFGDPDLTAQAQYNSYAARNGLSADVATQWDGRLPGRTRELSNIRRSGKAAKHDAANPAVQRAYEKMKTELRQQYESLVDAGYKFSMAYNGEGGRVFTIEDHTGQKWSVERPTRELPEDHPMTEEFSGPQGEGWSYEDALAAVHDVLGHRTTGARYDMVGNERAWDAHAKIFQSREARRAFTNETRVRELVGEGYNKARLAAPAHALTHGDVPSVDETRDIVEAEARRREIVRMEEGGAPVERSPEARAADVKKMVANYAITSGLSDAMTAELGSLKDGTKNYTPADRRRIRATAQRAEEYVQKFKAFLAGNDVEVTVHTKGKSADDPLLTTLAEITNVPTMDLRTAIANGATHFLGGDVVVKPVEGSPGKYMVAHTFPEEVVIDAVSARARAADEATANDVRRVMREHGLVEDEDIPADVRAVFDDAERALDAGTGKGDDDQVNMSRAGLTGITGEGEIEAAMVVDTRSASGRQLAKGYLKAAKEIVDILRKHGAGEGIGVNNVVASLYSVNGLTEAATRSGRVVADALGGSSLFMERLRDVPVAARLEVIKAMDKLGQWIEGKEGEFGVYNDRHELGSIEGTGAAIPLAAAAEYHMLFEKRWNPDRGGDFEQVRGRIMTANVFDDASVKRAGLTPEQAKHARDIITSADEVDAYKDVATAFDGVDGFTKYYSLSKKSGTGTTSVRFQAIIPTFAGAAALYTIDRYVEQMEDDQTYFGLPGSTYKQWLNSGTGGLTAAGLYGMIGGMSLRGRQRAGHGVKSDMPLAHGHNLLFSAGVELQRVPGISKLMRKVSGDQRDVTRVREMGDEGKALFRAEMERITRKKLSGKTNAPVPERGSPEFESAVQETIAAHENARIPVQAVRAGKYLGRTFLQEVSPWFKSRMQDIVASTDAKIRAETAVIAETARNAIDNVVSTFKGNARFVDAIVYKDLIATELDNRKHLPDNDPRKMGPDEVETAIRSIDGLIRERFFPESQGEKPNTKGWDAYVELQASLDPIRRFDMRSQLARLMGVESYNLKSYMEKLSANIKMLREAHGAKVAELMESKAAYQKRWEGKQLRESDLKKARDAEGWSDVEYKRRVEELHEQRDLRKQDYYSNIAKVADAARTISRQLDRMRQRLEAVGDIEARELNSVSRGYLRRLRDSGARWTLRYEDDLTGVNVRLDLTDEWDVTTKAEELIAQSRDARGITDEQAWDVVDDESIFFTAMRNEKKVMRAHPAAIAAIEKILQGNAIVFTGKLDVIDGPAPKEVWDVIPGIQSEADMVQTMMNFMDGTADEASLARVMKNVMRTVEEPSGKKTHYRVEINTERFREMVRTMIDPVHPNLIRRKNVGGYYNEGWSDKEKWNWFKSSVESMLASGRSHDKLTAYRAGANEMLDYLQKNEINNGLYDAIVEWRDRTMQSLAGESVKLANSPAYAIRRGAGLVFLGGRANIPIANRIYGFQALATMSMQDAMLQYTARIPGAGKDGVDQVIYFRTEMEQQDYLKSNPKAVAVNQMHSLSDGGKALLRVMQFSMWPEKIAKRVAVSNPWFRAVKERLDGLHIEEAVLTGSFTGDSHKVKTRTGKLLTSAPLTGQRWAEEANNRMAAYSYVMWQMDKMGLDPADFNTANAADRLKIIDDLVNGAVMQRSRTQGAFSGEDRSTPEIWMEQHLGGIGVVANTMTAAPLRAMEAMLGSMLRATGQKTLPNKVKMALPVFGGAVAVMALMGIESAPFLGDAAYITDWIARFWDDDEDSLPGGYEMSRPGTFERWGGLISEKLGMGRKFGEDFVRTFSTDGMIRAYGNINIGNDGSIMGVARWPGLSITETMFKNYTRPVARALAEMGWEDIAGFETGRPMGWGSWVYAEMPRMLGTEGKHLMQAGIQLSTGVRRDAMGVPMINPETRQYEPYGWKNAAKQAVFGYDADRSRASRELYEGQYSLLTQENRRDWTMKVMGALNGVRFGPSPKHHAAYMARMDDDAPMLREAIRTKYGTYGNDRNAMRSEVKSWMDTNPVIPTSAGPMPLDKMLVEMAKKGQSSDVRARTTPSSIRDRVMGYVDEYYYNLSVAQAVQEFYRGDIPIEITSKRLREAGNGGMYAVGKLLSAYDNVDEFMFGYQAGSERYPGPVR